MESGPLAHQGTQANFEYFLDCFGPWQKWPRAGRVFFWLIQTWSTFWVTCIGILIISCFFVVDPKFPYFRFQNSGFLNIWISRLPHIWISRLPKIWIYRLPPNCISRFPDFPKLDFPMSGFPWTVFWPFEDQWHKIITHMFHPYVLVRSLEICSPYVLVRFPNIYSIHIFSTKFLILFCPGSSV